MARTITTILAVAALASSSFASTLNPGIPDTLGGSHSGSIDTSSPQFNPARPNASGSETAPTTPTAVDGTDAQRYSAATYTAGTTGAHNFYSAQSFDGYLCLYGASFDASAPLTGVLACDDDMSTLNGGEVEDRNGITGTSDSGFQFSLTSGDTYNIVTTHWAPADATGPIGDFYNEVRIANTGTPDTITNGNFTLGALPTDGSTVMGPGQSPNTFHTNVLAGLDYFTFDVTGGVGAPGSYLNIQTVDPSSGDTIDTEIGLYDAAGMRVALDDDGQATAFGGNYSLLTFGDADPLSGDQTAGADGSTLAAGSYTLVVGPFDADFATTLGDVMPGTGTFATRAGDYDIQFTYAVPEPTSMLMLLAGLFGLGVCRRK